MKTNLNEDIRQCHSLGIFGGRTAKCSIWRKVENISVPAVSTEIGVLTEVIEMGHIKHCPGLNICAPPKFVC